jgi:signal transduction histidine kinase
MSLEDSTMVLDNLQKIIVISYPLVLLILFLIARFIAGRSIKPINTIIETSNKITKDNLSDRISLPQNKDELYVVSQTINNLLDRLEKTIEREKQFTSDASHELRTPLAVIKGTLEVLIRKPRDTQEYHDKINFCILEVDRINNLVDQLLLLTRFENQRKSLKNENFSLNQIIEEVLIRFQSKSEWSEITFIKDYSGVFVINSDSHLLTIIINNLISNAIKYSLSDAKVTLSIYKDNENTVLEIKDNGIGISASEITKVFDSFYRTTNSIEYPEVKGIGLGLSIVKRLCDLLSIKVEISSELNHGTTLKLSIP